MKLTNVDKLILFLNFIVPAGTFIVLIICLNESIPNNGSSFISFLLWSIGLSLVSIITMSIAYILALFLNKFRK